MKTLASIFAVVLLLFVGNKAYAQKILDKVASETCDCVNKAQVSDNINMEEYQALISACLATPLTANYEKLCKELKIPNDQSEVSYQQLGVKIAAKLLESCPRFMELSMKVENNKTNGTNSGGTTTTEESGKTGTSTGVVKSVEAKDFYFITITNSLGSKETFIWLRYFTGSANFENNPTAQVGKNITITYREIKLFSASQGDYVVYKEIIDLKYND